MNVDSVVHPPFVTADLPGVGGRLKTVPEDFDVEEIPAYAASDSGDFLYLWVEKRGMGAEYFVRQIARRLDIPVGEVGTAGLKDRHAVTRQMVSVPAAVEERLSQLDGDGIRVLQVSRHSNKLRPGHLHGNRFRIVIRELDPQANVTEVFPRILSRLKELGLPNYYGPQRFGRDGETLHLGLHLLGGRLLSEETPTQDFRPPKRVNPFLKKLALSAAQSGLFNHYLARRLAEGLLHRVIPGDVMAKVPFGGLFVAQDVPTEQSRFDRREIVPAGPIFGRKTFAALGEAAARETAALAAFGLAAASFGGFGKLVQGTRRHNLIFLEDFTATSEPNDRRADIPVRPAGPESPASEGPTGQESPATILRLSFSLPAGSYATVLLREFMKEDVDGEEEA